MDILVTGGRGFIGRHVMDALLEAGHDVHDLDLAVDAVYKADICEYGKVLDVFRADRPDVVFHVAAVADARAVLKDPVKAMRVNVMGTTNVLKAAVEAGVKRVVISSTCWVANAMDFGVLTENAWFNPQGAGHIYTTTKIVSELLAHDFQRLYGLDFTILRYGIPYGPGMWPGLVLRNWCDAAAEGRPLTIFGDGSSSRRFVYVGDLAQAHALVLQDVARNQVYNLEGMRSVSIKELAEVFQRVWPGEVNVEYREEPTRVGELAYQRKILSTDKAFSELGWEPRVDLEEGVRQVVAWYREETTCERVGVEEGVLA